MVANLKSVVRLWWLYARMDLNWLMQDFGSALLVMLSETLSSISSLVGVLLLAIRFGGVGGLSADQVLFMLGFFKLADGICWVFFGNYNILHLSRRIGRGQIDHMLIQPRPLWMQLLTEGAMPFSGCSGLLIGLALTAIAVHRLGIALSPLWVGLVVYYLLIHVILRLSQTVLYGSLAFWRPVACEEISTMIIDLDNQLGKFPLFGLPTWLSALLHTAFPIGLLGYLPALAQQRELGLGVEIGLPFCVAAVFTGSATLLFQKGLKRYEEYSCNRYKEMGHRC